MGIHLYRRAPQPNAVNPGAISTFQLPLGPTYRQLLLRYKSGAGVDAPEATMAADILEIRLKINGIIRWEISGARLITLLKYYGYTIDDGVLPLFFSRTNARLLSNEDALAIGTANVQTLTLEVDIAGAALTPDLALDTWYDPVKQPLGGIIEIHTNTFATSVAGLFEVSDLPRQNGDLVAVHLFNGTLTKLEVRYDELAHLDGDLEGLEASYKWTGRVPQTNVRHYEPTWLDRFNDRIPLSSVQDFRLKLTMSAAGSVPIVMETYNTPLGPVQAAA